MFPTQYYDDNTGSWVKNGTLSHVDYHGEVHYVPKYDESGKYIDSIQQDPKHANRGTARSPAPRAFVKLALRRDR